MYKYNVITYNLSHLYKSKIIKSSTISLRFVRRLRDHANRVNFDEVKSRSIILEQSSKNSLSGVETMDGKFDRRNQTRN